MAGPAEPEKEIETSEPARRDQGGGSARAPLELVLRIGRDGAVIPWAPSGEDDEKEAVEEEEEKGEEDEDQPQDEWEIVLEFRETQGRLYPCRLELREGMFHAGLPLGGISARLLHAIKLGELVDEFNQQHADHLAAEEFFFGRKAKPGYELPPRTNRPGPRGLGEEFYQDVAVRYLEALRTNPRSPIKGMLSFYPKHSRAIVRDWVFRARLKGYLTKIGKGFPGGGPTEKLLEALRARDLTLPEVADQPKTRVRRHAETSRPNGGS